MRCNSREYTNNIQLHKLYLQNHLGRYFVVLTGPGGEVALQFLANPLDYLDEVSSRFGNLVSLRLAGERVVLVADPRSAEQLLITENHKVAKVHDDVHIHVSNVDLQKHAQKPLWASILTLYVIIMLEDKEYLENLPCLIFLVYLNFLLNKLSSSFEQRLVLVKQCTAVFCCKEFWKIVPVSTNSPELKLYHLLYCLDQMSRRRHHCKACCFWSDQQSMFHLAWLFSVRRNKILKCWSTSQ